MSVGKVVLDAIKYYLTMGVEVIDIVRVDSNQGTIVVPDGQIVFTKVDANHYNIEIHSDRVYAGVERCSSDEVESILAFLLRKFERMKETDLKKKKQEAEKLSRTSATKQEKK